MSNIGIHPDLIHEMLLRNGKVTLLMYGSSMSPILTKGRSVSVTSIGSGKIGVGDIICVKSNSKLVAHRLVRIVSSKDGWYYITKGDNRPNFDEPLRRENIVGKVVEVEGRRVTGTFSKIPNLLLANLSYLEAALPRWRGQSRAYACFSRLKTWLGIRRSLYPYCYRLLGSLMRFLTARLSFYA